MENMNNNEQREAESLAMFVIKNTQNDNKFVVIILAIVLVISLLVNAFVVWKYINLIENMEITTTTVTQEGATDEGANYYQSGEVYNN